MRNLQHPYTLPYITHALTHLANVFQAGRRGDCTTVLHCTALYCMFYWKLLRDTWARNLKSATASTTTPLLNSQQAAVPLAFKAVRHVGQETLQCASLSSRRRTWQLFATSMETVQAVLPSSAHRLGQRHERQASPSRQAPLSSLSGHAPRSATTCSEALVDRRLRQANTRYDGTIFFTGSVTQRARLSC